MSKFLITMNMPTRNGNAVHQVIADHSSKTIEEFMRALQDNDFIIVDEYYKDQYGEYYNIGKALVNHRYVGKVRVFGNDIHHNKRDGDKNEP